jgi:hypothetical protein
VDGLELRRMELLTQIGPRPTELGMQKALPVTVTVALALAVTVTVDALALALHSLAV